MELDDKQKQAVRQWVTEGAGLSEIQKRLSREFGLSLTYMEVRLLALDWGLKIREKPSASAPTVGAADRTADSAPPPGDPRNAAPGRVSVDVDRVTKPGMLVSGTVRFGDGVTASWFLDELGRLGLNPSRRGYKPSEQDLRAFQEELQSQLAKRGY